MLYSKDEIQHLKTLISIEDLARQLGLSVLHHKSKCIHPENHAKQDRTPSLSFSSSKGYFRCWVCESVRGDHFDLIRLTLHLSFPEAVAWLKNHLNYQTSLISIKSRAVNSVQSVRSVTPIEDDQNKVLIEKKSRILADFFELLEPPKGEVELYLRKRKIFSQCIQKMGILSIPHPSQFGEILLERHSLWDLQEVGLFSSKGYFSYWNHPIIFPYYQGKEKVWFQARSIHPQTAPKELNFRGEMLVPYNVNQLNGKIGHVYLCEGVIDALTLIQRGMEAVAIPGVQSFKKEWLALFENKTVTLLLDGDYAGQKAAQSIFEMMKSFGIRVLWEITQENETLSKYKSATDFLKAPISWGKDVNDLFK